MIPTNDPRLTAYALGEMNEHERQAFEAELMKSEEAQREVAELSSAAELLGRELARDVKPALAAEQKQAIADAAAGGSAAPPAKPEAAPKLAPVVALRPSFARRALYIAGPLAVAAGVLGMLALGGGTLSEKSASEDREGQAPAMSSAGARSKSAPSSRPMATAAADAPSPGKMKQDSIDRKWRHDGDAEELPGPRPSGIPSDSALPENPFIKTTVDPKSTFSIDVDTASYSMIRRLLESGQKPQAGLVRIEEMVNYFPYSYPKADDAAFSVHADSAAAPWNPAHRLVRIGLQGMQVEFQKRPASNLVFLIDTSGSMNGADRIDLLKKGFELLVDQLDSRDKVSIVVYAGSAGLVLPPTSGDQKKTIKDALASLSSGGSTNGGQGIKLAYETASKAFIEGGTNRVILASDGDFNVGVTSQDELVKLIEQKAKTNVFLTVLGFGTGNYRDGTAEKLANKGNGNYAYIDGLAEAKKVLVNQASGTLLTIAKDVKIQITFDPKAVETFRLIGYENRVLAHQDFEDDKKDAGDIGAGHQVTALYEIVTKPGAGDKPHLADISLRFKQPDGVTSRLVETSVKDSGTAFQDASTDFRFAASVAGFGMLLRGSEHKGDLTYDKVLKIAQGATGDDGEGYRKEFVGLVEKAARIGDR